MRHSRELLFWVVVALLQFFAELDAINLYEQMAAMVKDKYLKKILLDIAKEEKTHVGEFLTLLPKKDVEQGVELEEGKKEVAELIEK